MAEEYENPEAMQSLKDSVEALSQSADFLTDMSNSVGFILTHLDVEEKNPEIQELLESAIMSVRSTVDKLNVVVNEHNQEKELKE